ncbi:flagellar basal-body MS-ring/collar protein FliF [Microbacterium oryzae]|uniref:flagellar basal-body MS-ring/collar protein FliF n=1 Tax=Microbacterium oryzae TaxID=743009 RepID=UPI0025B1E611|nr:flagellar basal-body MS-ring/collar protein FliF [Microbacterium oryzae]MDN3309658.1 flagellar basal-body MS-ring/collar protein FliF [Microbacterium oryzae]
MPKMITSVLDRAKEVVGGFTVAQRTIALIGVALLAMGAIALGTWLSRPQMSPLFTGLSAADASAVVEQLKSAGVDYELTEGGATILVPDDEVYPQRLAAASAGLPGDSSDGYTLLDDMGVTASEFQQSVTYKRAIEGELASTIGAMTGVTSASVQLAIPEESVFVADRQDPTASVFVRTQSGVTLDDDQVEAIVHLTSAAVTGMSPEDVAVTDQDGHVLSAVGSGLTGGADKQATEYESKVAATVGQMLETIVGPGNASVSVAADVANSTSERLEETYTAPEGELAPSEQTKTETYSGGAGGEAGVLGPDNIAAPAQDGTGSYELEETTRNNAVNKATEKTVTPSGEVTRQTVSIALNRDAVDGVTAEQVQALVATAAGIDTERGDSVTVEFVAFSQAGAEAAAAALAEAEAAEEARRQEELLRTTIIGGAIVLAAIVLAVMMAIRGRRRRRVDELVAQPAMSALLPPDDDVVLLTSVPEPAPRAAPAALAPTEVIDIVDEPEPEPVQMLVERRRREVDQIARTDPEAAAAALSSMMDEASA